MAKKETQSPDNQQTAAPEDQGQERAEPTIEAQAAGEAGEGATAAELQALLDEANAKAEDYWNQLLRSKADLDNMRRRMERDLESAHKFGVEKLVMELLPVRDSMELGLAAISSESTEVAKFREGSELTLKMLDGALEKFGVQEINPVGEKFNPERHQAMSMQETAEVEPNTVVTVVQKGYMLHDRLVRPAMVIVSKTATPPPNERKVDEMA